MDPTDDASRQSMSKTVASAFSSNPLIGGGGGGTPATSGGPTATSGGSESKKFTGHQIAGGGFAPASPLVESSRKEQRVARRGEKLASRVEKTEKRIAATSNKAEKGRLGSKLKYLQKRQTT